MAKTAMAMTMGDVALAFGLALVVMILNVAASFGWVFVYSQLEPGQTDAAYRAYAERTAPLSSVLFGVPLMFAAGWFAGRKRPARRAQQTGLAIGAFYVAVDITILLVIGGIAQIAGWVALSATTKIFSGWAGARVASGR